MKRHSAISIQVVGMLLLLAATLHAQKSDIKFERLTVEDGLSSNHVYSILHDSQGFIWFGTSEGLNRFDGYSFKAYRHDPTDTTSISDNFIWFESLVEDPFGMIWVGTKTAGLNRFDRISETFKRFQHDPDDSSSLSSNNNLSLWVDHSNTLWVGTDWGLNKFDRATETFQRFLHDPKDSTSLVHNNIGEIHETGSGDETQLWIATLGGLDKFDPKSGRFEHIKLGGLYPESRGAEPVTDIYGDGRGTLWLGSFQGLVKLNLRTMATKFYRHDPENINSLNFNVVTDIWQDPGTQGRVLWITTRIGLNRFDTETETFSHYGNIRSNSLHEDKTQRLWIGSFGGGVHSLNRPTKEFSFMGHDPGNPNSLSWGHVDAIYQDQAGILWIGTNDRLNKLDRDAGLFTEYSFDPDTSSFISGIAEAQNGMLWLGIWGNGLIKFDPETGQFRKYRHDPSTPGSLPSNLVGRVYFDRFGTLWFGTDTQALTRLLPEGQETGRFTNFELEFASPKAFENGMDFAFLEDSRGEFWLGSHLKGLYRFDRETEQFTPYKHDPNNTKSLSNNTVYSLIETVSERDTLMWVGTSNGLNRFDRGSQTFKRIYNIQPGGSDFIFSLISDDHGSLWIQNQKGVSKYDINQETFTNFAGSRGLPADMQNQFGAYRSGNGEIFFGGMRGMIHFHPDSILNNSHVPRVVLTDFKILNEPAVLDSSITVKKRVDLTHDQNFFSFEFAALDYTDPKKNQYAYKLEGLDESWINSDTRRFANYTAVAPGKYTFRVKGSNNDGVWNEEGASLIINISPPWWRTNWAYALYGILFGLTLYACDGSS